MSLDGSRSARVRVSRAPSEQSAVVRALHFVTSGRVTTAVGITVILLMAARGLFGLLPTPVSLATLALDAIVVGMAAVLLLALIVRDARVVRPLVWAVLALALMQVALFPFSGESLADKFLAVRNTVLYATVGVFIASFATARAATILLRVVRWAGLALAAFGIVQFVLRNSLPQWLLKPADAETFTYWGTDIVRANGLVGNTIVFAAVILLVFCLWLARAISGSGVDRRRIVAFVATAVVFVAIVLSFSRVAMALAVGVAVGMLMLSAARAGRRQLARAAVALASVVAGLVVFILAVPPVREAVAGSFIVSSLFGSNNASVEGSTALHASFNDIALQTLAETPWIGRGVGTQTQGSQYSADHAVITDGALLSTFVEGGAVLLLPTVAFFGVCLVVLLRRWWTSGADASSSALLAVAAYLGAQFFLASTLNSAFYGKPAFVLFWVCFGSAVVLGRLAKDASAVEVDEVAAVPGSNDEAAR